MYWIFLHQNPDVNIIDWTGWKTFDLSDLDQSKGEIILQESLNNITAENHRLQRLTTNYWTKKRKRRSQKSWGTIENIKELKEGVISHKWCIK